MPRLRLFPLTTVLFPGAVLNLHVFEPRYKQMVAQCLEDGEPFGVALIREGDETGDPDVMPHAIGTTVHIAEVRRLEGGRYYLSTVGGRRFRLDRLLARDPYLEAEVTYLNEDGAVDVTTIEQLIADVRDVFGEYSRLLVEFSGIPGEGALPDNPSDASFAIGDALQIADSLKQRLLELSNTEQRLTVELGFLRRLLPQLRALLERKSESAPRHNRLEAPGMEFRSNQERYFGRHFSLN